MKIEVSSEIRTACPAFAGVAISAKVVNTAYNEELWKKINEFTVRYREMYTTDSIKDMTTIHATREAIRNVARTPAVTVLREKHYAAGYFAEFHSIR